MLAINANILVITVNVNRAKLSNQIKEKEYRHIRNGRGTRVQIANIRWIIEKAREFQKNIYYFFIDYARPQQTGKFLKKWEYQTILPASWETSIQVKKQQLEPDMQQ